MNEPIELELAKQRRAALDLIAARCAEALRAVERQVDRSHSGARMSRLADAGLEAAESQRPRQSHARG